MLLPFLCCKSCSCIFFANKGTNWMNEGMNEWVSKWVTNKTCCQWYASLKTSLIWSDLIPAQKTQTWVCSCCCCFLHSRQRRLQVGLYFFTLFPQKWNITAIPSASAWGSLCFYTSRHQPEQGEVGAAARASLIGLVIIIPTWVLCNLWVIWWISGFSSIFSNIMVSVNKQSKFLITTHTWLELDDYNNWGSK